MAVPRVIGYTIGMSLKSKIETLLQTDLRPSVVEVENESHRHNVPKGSETHFKVTVVSEAFGAKSLVDRHRLIYQTLKEPMQNGVHALAIHAFTPDEWEKQGKAAASPLCLGGESERKKS